MVLLLLSIFLLISAWCEAVLRAGILGGVKNIYCPYQPQFSMVPKHLCHKRTDTNSYIIASTDRVANPQGRFFIYDDQQRRVVTVTITQVSDSDTREYWCGVFDSTGIFVFFEKVDFWAMPLTGHTGGEAVIRFLYGPGYEQKTKYLSRPGTKTSLLIHTQRGHTRADNDKFSLYDNTMARTLTATIRGLQAEDSGKYVFGMENAGCYVEWPLAVKGLTVVSYYEGRSVDISCKYPRTSKKRSKHFCRGKDPVECLEQGLSGDGRLTLKDLVADQVFIVTISDLTAEDAGIYWCVEFTDRGPEFTSAIQLTVKKFSPQTDSGTDSPQTDSPQTPSGSDTNSAIWVLVPVVVLLLLGIGLLVVVKYKKKKSEQPPNLPGNQMSTDTARTRNETVDYENDVVHACRKTRANPPTPPNSDPEYQNSDTSAVPLYLAVIPTSTESAPTNQTLDNKTGRQSVATSQTLNVNPCQKVFVCHTPHLSTSLNIPTYQQLNPNTNQGDSGYMSL
ncbi:polymeric immunoglobulin receptor-like isoform X1 [Alosa sapidissima]|uniref:polymeric immunoglobulin receptor-like isoform X1 n=1 Tax=Alosa sapidissima TaxID=34773 RepID=UPI001C08C0FB|nr:polymeric immunoglobulin receptor-like isoform X1 [Alosa sapidissima]